MSCASCALLIELSLRRDPRVQLANVNFAAQTALVRGTLGRDDVFALVGRLSYRAQPIYTLAQRRLLVERAKEQLRIRQQNLRPLGFPYGRRSRPGQPHILIHNLRISL
jgi:Cu+-exporting ATPase